MNDKGGAVSIGPGRMNYKHHLIDDNIVKRRIGLNTSYEM